ncbi:MAG: hypothetical protein ABW153_14695 [Sedimenticola sp.]
MFHFKLLFWTMLLVMLTGCMGVPVSYSESEDQFNQNIEKLIGNDSVAVEETLGHPTSRIRFYDSTVSIYARIAEANVLDLMVPVGTYKSTVLLCYTLMFDANYRLTNFSRGWYAYSGYHTPRHLCQLWVNSKDYRYDLFDSPQPYNPKNVPVSEDFYECNYEEEQRKASRPVYWRHVKRLWLAHEDELTVAAESGNPEARLQLYWNDTREGQYWLCLAANQGYPKASYRVAQLYEFGDDDVTKDIQRAYLWYDAAAKSCHPWARKDAQRISHDLLNRGEQYNTRHMMDEWMPLDCKEWPRNH